MLTPDKIREKSFQTTGRGSYRAEDVDTFLEEVVASYEQMFKENSDLIKKISLLAKKVEEYRADEDSLKMALLNAQKLADKIVAEARETAEKENAEINAEIAKFHEVAKNAAEEAEAKAKVEAEKIIADANAQAKEIVGNANRTVTHQSLVYEMLQKETSEFKGKLIAMYKEHISIINQLPEIADEKLDEETPVEQEVVEETVEETVVIDETPVVVIDDVEEIDEDAATEEVVVEEIVEEVVEIEEPIVTEEIVNEDVVEEATEEVVESPVAKKSFKLDLSKIDFADDNDFVEETVVPAVNEVEAEFEEQDSETDAPKSISFKNFFKKK